MSLHAKHNFSTPDHQILIYLPTHSSAARPPFLVANAPGLQAQMHKGRLEVLHGWQWEVAEIDSLQLVLTFFFFSIFIWFFIFFFTHGRHTINKKFTKTMLSLEQNQSNKQNILLSGDQNSQIFGGNHFLPARYSDFGRSRAEVYKPDRRCGPAILCLCKASLRGATLLCLYCMHTLTNTLHTPQIRCSAKVGLPQSLIKYAPLSRLPD